MIKFKAYSDLDGEPNIIVDGPSHRDSVLVLSHWKRSGTLRPYLRDTSAEIVLDYIAKNELPPEARAVSNDHFDADGLVGIFSILNRDYALARKESLVDIAEAGDFRKFKEYDSAKVIFTISKLLRKESGFMAQEVYLKRYPEYTAACYSAMLEIFPDIIEDLEKYEAYWAGEFESLKRSEELITRGEVSVKEMPESDLAIVTLPALHDAIHEMAINNLTERTQIITHQGQKFSFMYRYETWVQYTSRSYPLRVNLSPLAERLNELERDGNVWEYQGSKNIAPYLLSEGMSSLSFERFYSLVAEALDSAEVDWDPAG